MIDTKYKLTGIILGIAMMAIFGVNRAINWLTQSTANDSLAADRIESVDGSAEGDFVSSNGQNLSDQNSNGQIVSQADGTEAILSPVEEAGTYIQRQKRVEEDAAVVGTQVNVIPAAEGVAARSDTRVVTQPESPVSPDTTPSSPATPVSPAVPALW
ncbi:MAG: hypothetical protein WA885_09220 [Phormidesmis sp.]